MNKVNAIFSKLNALGQNFPELNLKIFRNASIKFFFIYLNLASR